MDFILWIISTCFLGYNFWAIANGNSDVYTYISVVMFVSLLISLTIHEFIREFKKI
jgi:hypothetical protein